MPCLLYAQMTSSNRRESLYFKDPFSAHRLHQLGCFSDDVIGALVGEAFSETLQPEHQVSTTGRKLMPVNE